MKKILTLLVATMIGISASAQYKAPKIIAHRGFHASEGAARNSLNALKAAQEAKIWGSECDIQLTKDGIPVVCHNFTIDETSNGVGAIKDMTLEELREFDFGKYKGPEFEGTKIPTLDEFLSLSEEMGDKMKVLDI